MSNIQERLSLLWTPLVGWGAEILAGRRWYFVVGPSKDLFRILGFFLQDEKDAAEMATLRGNRRI